MIAANLNVASYLFFLWGNLVYIFEIMTFCDTSNVYGTRHVSNEDYVVLQIRYISPPIFILTFIMPINILSH